MTQECVGNERLDESVGDHLMMTNHCKGPSPKFAVLKT